MLAVGCVCGVKIMMSNRIIPMLIWEKNHRMDGQDTTQLPGLGQHTLEEAGKKKKQKEPPKRTRTAGKCYHQYNIHKRGN